MPDSPAYQRAIRAAYRVEHQLYGLETRTIAQIKAELELARRSVIATIATAEKGWQIAQAQSLLVEIERQLRAWSAVASNIATGQLGEVADLGVEQVMSALRAGGLSLGAGPMISRDFVAVAYQTMPYLITNIGDDVLRRVTSILHMAVLAQRTPLDAMHEIGTLTGKGVFRSAFERGETIIRTENGRIAQTANYSTLSTLAQDQPGLRKEWSAVVDFRTRPSHAAADGERRDVDKPYSVGGHPAMYPHDPRLPAHESIACRCVSVPFDEAWDLSDERWAPKDVDALRDMAGPAFALDSHGRPTIAGRVATRAEADRAVAHVQERDRLAAWKAEVAQQTDAIMRGFGGGPRKRK